MLMTTRQEGAGGGGGGVENEEEIKMGERRIKSINAERQASVITADLCLPRRPVCSRLLK